MMEDASSDIRHREQLDLESFHLKAPPDPDKDDDSVHTATTEKKGRFPPLFSGIKHDIIDFLPQYVSDWKDAWNYRVIPSVVETYLNNLLPAIAFAQDMFDHTDNAFGVNEVLLSSGMAGVVFGVIGGQPLCIVGVTGPIAIFNYTVYDIIKPLGINYFGFMFWVCIWAMILHVILAITNMMCLLQFVTEFPCDVFGFFINVVYIQKGIDILTKQFTHEGEVDTASGFASIAVALLMTAFGVGGKLFNITPLFTHKLRTIISDYSTAASVVFWSGFTHFGGYLNDVKFRKLEISKAFDVTSITRSGWFAYHSIPVKYVFLALPFGLILTILFYFDHNVSSLMAQRRRYNLKKASTFHYDFLLLSFTTGVSGILGIPAPNGLIPQAPLHTESLLVRDSEGNIIRCVEQRFTNTVQGLMMLGTMTRPLLQCLGQIPQAVLSALFLTMGITGLHGNAIIKRVIWLVTDRKMRDKHDRLNTVPTKPLLIFTTIGVISGLIEFALTLSKAAIAFPVVLLITVLMSMSFKRWFKHDHLAILDGQVGEPHTMKNLQRVNL
ncbi:HCL615Wp [Eremothecium sinecaudum]|uniref:HCL615Wp n=1 Tax=Eremothecium sinecaudum TaxID=45286 RepID=A0A109UVW9_9SACH|nr:HCL615Wp [Eremothecium sinecaudum]AMD19536.1 HCL615Wp [Eremothecium sinecaudum]